MTHAADRALEHHGINLRPGDERAMMCDKLKNRHSRVRQTAAKYGAHTIYRARERYGVELTKKEMHKLTADIRFGRSVLKAKGAGETRDVREIHYVKYGQEWITVVYHRARRKIITILPYSAAHKVKHARRPMMFEDEPRH